MKNKRSLLARVAGSATVALTAVVLISGCTSTSGIGTGNDSVTFKVSSSGSTKTATSIQYTTKLNAKDAGKTEQVKKVKLPWTETVKSSTAKAGSLIAVTTDMSGGIRCEVIVNGVVRGEQQSNLNGTCQVPEVFTGQ
jgi:hypothetical protein